MLRIFKKDFILMFSDTKQRISLIFLVPFFLLSIDTQNMEWLYFIIIMGIFYVLALIPFYYDMNNKSTS